MAGIRLPEHSHCIYCGDPIPFGEEYCNDECRKGERDRIAAEKKRDNMFYIGSIITVVVIVTIGLLI